ncbi:MAG TPA: ATPase [Bacteroidales bacterium]|nr:ATPase [Bacteroidales bacterium]HPI86754.1 ATPase [Bacteroidales bacterium]HPM91779.1 ATPase [Bacteroidales bacterium]
MDTPFIFGKLATGENFTDREAEQQRLIQNFRSGTNTILISPRRWGKSSLVHKSAQEAKKAEHAPIMVFIDLFNIRSEEDFYKCLAESVIRATSGRMEEIMSNIKEFMKEWVPRISFSPDAHHEFSLSLDWAEIKKQPDEILNLAENIAVAKNRKIVICLDEFQNIAFYENPLAFQKKLRSHWQKHQMASYCIYGSKRHMLLDVFTSPSMPFYRFGDMMFLPKISIDYWIPFIQERFKSTGKDIDREQAERIATLTECHPYYVQQLAQQTWLRTEKAVTIGIIDEALDNLVLQMSLLFQNITEDLTTSYVNFLKMILDGHTRYTSMENIDRYQLGTSANVIRIRKALISKEIIDEYEGKAILLDPLYAIWLKKYYF